MSNSCKNKICVCFVDPQKWSALARFTCPLWQLEQYLSQVPKMVHSRFVGTSVTTYQCRRKGGNLAGDGFHFLQGTSECLAAGALLKSIKLKDKTILADKAYNCEHIRLFIAEHGAFACIQLADCFENFVLLVACVIHL